MNAYGIDLRTRVINYLDEGHTYKTTSDLFNVAIRTISNWVSLRKETGSLKAIPVPRSPHKLFDKELLEYVKLHPDAYLREIATHFNCRISSAHDALKRLNVTYKKNRRFIKRETKRSGKDSSIS
jgi:transposase